MRQAIQKILGSTLFLAALGLPLLGIATENLEIEEASDTIENHEVIPSRKVSQIIEEEPPRFEILLNIAATQLTVFDKGVPVRHHKVSVGTPRWPTPVGKFNIYEIEWNPWWLPPPSDWAKDAEKTPPGPNNPLYPVKLIMEKALRIHGTRSSWSIGHAASHGCMRMRRSEVRDLAEFFEANLVPDHKAEVFEEYRRKAWQPYRTVLPKENNIWVYMVYAPLERWSNQLVLHPNYYGRRIPYEEKVIDLLMEAGVYSAPVDLGKFHDIRKKSRRTTLIPFQDILADDSVLEGLPEQFSSMCLAEEPHRLAQVRERFNTHMVSTRVPLDRFSQK